MHGTHTPPLALYGRYEPTREHMVQLVTPQHICVPPATLSVSIGTRNASDGTIGISVTSDRVALWVRGRASCAVHWQQPWALELALRSGAQNR